MQAKAKRYVILAVVVFLLMALAASTALNVFLFDLVRGYYHEVNEVRLDPAGLTIYPENTATALPSGTRLVVFWGDSRAENWTAPEIPGFIFLNRGIIAQTTAQVMARLDAHLAPLRPDVVVIQVGINDLRAVPLFPERAEQIITDCIRNIDAMIAYSRDLGAAVVITTVFPVGEVPLQRRWQWSDAVNPAVERVNAHIRRIAMDGVIVVDSYETLVDPASELAQPRYVESFMHINASGYGALNVLLVPVLQRIATG